MPTIQPKINMVELSISNLAATNPMNGSYLTPDALMSYCSTRLRGLDEQIRTSFEKQKAANDDSATLSQLSLAIGSPSGDLTLSGDADTDQKEVFYAAGDKILKAADQVKDPAVRAALIKAAEKLVHLDKQVDANGKETYTVKRDGLVGTGGGGFQDKGSVPAAKFKEMTADAIGSIQKDLNSDTELSMINLQSLMSQRQSSVQLVTNMVQSLGDQLNKIASNIGH